MRENNRELRLINLPSGIDVIFDRDVSDKVFSLGIWFNTGSADDGENLGISHLIEHMLFKGTENRSQLDIAKQVEAFGGNINACTSREYTCYYIKALSENVKQTFDILADMITSPKIDYEDLKMEKRVVIEENKMLSDQPDEAASEQFIKTLFSGSPMGNEIGGNEESVSDITVEDIRRYMNDRYTKDNLVVCISGNFNEEEVLDCIENSLSKLPTKKKNNIWTLVDYKPRFQSIYKESNATHLMIGCPTVKANSVRENAMSLITMMLGGSMTSRLFQQIREKLGLAYSVYATNVSNSQSGMLEIYTSFSYEKLSTVVSEIRGVLKDFKRGFTVEEFNIANKICESSLLFGSETSSSRMFRYGAKYMLGKRLESIEESIDKIKSVKIKDVEELSQSIIDFPKFSAVAVGEASESMDIIRESWCE